MDLTLTGPEQALADECRSWLREHLPWEYGRGRPPRFDDLAAEVAFGRAGQAAPRGGRGGGGRGGGAGGSASHGPRGTAGATQARSATTSSPRSSPARTRRNSSAAS